MKSYLRMSFILFITLVAVVTHHADAKSRELGTAIKITEHNLGTACIENITCPDDKWGLDLIIDLYQPSHVSRRRRRPGYLRHNRHRQDLPFLILACGGNADKGQYSGYAASLARLGYTVAVMNKLLFMTPPPPATADDKIMLNAVTSVDFNRVIEYAQTNVTLGINATSVVLLGHSYGGAMALSTARGFCYSFFCGDGPPTMTTTQLDYPVALSSAVVGGFVHGASIYQVGFPGEPIDRDLTNVNSVTETAVPFFFLWGEYEMAVNNERDGQYIYRTTWENQQQPKAYAIGEDLDHDSIANERFSQRNIMNSTLPRSVQIHRVVATTDAWVEYLMNGEQNLMSSVFCFQLGIPLVRNDQHWIECKLDHI